MPSYRIGRSLSSGHDGAVRSWNCRGICSSDLRVRGADLPLLPPEPLKKRPGAVVWCLAVDWTLIQPQALTGGADRMVRLWTVNEAHLLVEMQGHAGCITCLSVSWHLRHAVSGATDLTLRLWEIDSGVCLRTLWSHEGPISCVSAEWEGPLVLGGSTDGCLKLWDVSKAACLHTFETPESPAVTCFDVSWGDRHNPRVVGLDSQEPERRLAMPRFLPRRVVVGSGEGEIRLWDLNSYECVAILEGHELAVSAVSAFWSLGQCISVAADGWLNLWDMAAASRLRSFRLLGGGALCLGVDWDQCIAMVGCEDGSLELWRVEQSELLEAREAHSGPVRAVHLETNADHIEGSG